MSIPYIKPLPVPVPDPDFNYVVGGQFTRWGRTWLVETVVTWGVHAITCDGKSPELEIGYDPASGFIGEMYQRDQAPDATFDTVCMEPMPFEAFYNNDGTPADPGRIGYTWAKQMGLVP